MNTEPHVGYITLTIKAVEDLPRVVDDFILYGQLKVNKKKTITNWGRERFIISSNTKQDIEFGEMDVVDLFCIETSGPVLLDIHDAMSTGFGQGGFGEGGFGGSDNPLKGFHANGVLMAEGKYKRMIMTNNTNVDITVDLYAAIYQTT